MLLDIFFACNLWNWQKNENFILNKSLSCQMIDEESSVEFT